MSRQMGARPHFVWMGAVGAALLAMSGCAALDSPDAEYAGVCVEESTQNRLPDEACGDWDDKGQGGGVGSYFVWVSTGSGADVPPVGRRVDQSLGGRTFPPGTPVAKGVSPQGQKVQRGGFGVKAGTSGGTGARAGGSGGS